MSYPQPRRVVLTLADLRRLTILERARAVAIVGVQEGDLARLLAAVGRGAGADLERGVELFYAIAWQLERRLDPSLSWDDAQALDLALDLDATEDPLAEAEALASVEAAVATGLAPAVAGELSLAQLEAYRTVRERPGKRRARSRVNR